MTAIEKGGISTWCYTRKCRDQGMRLAWTIGTTKQTWSNCNPGFFLAGSPSLAWTAPILHRGKGSGAWPYTSLSLHVDYGSNHSQQSQWEYKSEWNVNLKREKCLDSRARTQQKSKCNCSKVVSNCCHCVIAGNIIMHSWATNCCMTMPRPLPSVQNRVWPWKMKKWRMINFCEIVDYHSEFTMFFVTFQNS